MANTDNNREQDNNSLRTVTSDSKNTSHIRGSSRKKDDLDLDFDFDFMKKQTGLHPESRDIVKDDPAQKHKGLEPTVFYGGNKGLVPQVEDIKATRTVETPEPQEDDIRIYDKNKSESGDDISDAADDTGAAPDSLSAAEMMQTREIDAVSDESEVADPLSAAEMMQTREIDAVSDAAETAAETVAAAEAVSLFNVDSLKSFGNKLLNKMSAMKDDVVTTASHVKDSVVTTASHVKDDIAASMSPSNDEITDISEVSEMKDLIEEPETSEVQEKESEAETGYEDVLSSVPADTPADEVTEPEDVEKTDDLPDDTVTEDTDETSSEESEDASDNVDEPETNEETPDEDADSGLTLEDLSEDFENEKILDADKEADSGSEEEELAFIPINRKGLSGTVKKKKGTGAIKPVSAAAVKSAAKKTSKKSGNSGKTTGKTDSSAPKKSSGGGSSGNGSNNGSKKKEKKKKVKKKRNKFVAFLRAFLIVIISATIVGGIAGTAYTAYVISKADTIHPDRIYDTLDVSTYIYDDKDKLIDEVYYNENRQITTYEQLPENLKNAFIAIEDKTFWTHKGFNIRRIFGAILEKFKGGRISGTSTITQQLARNVFLPDEKSERSIKRKITEMYYAYQIEEELSKEEILTAYLNTIYLGFGCYGVDTASRLYFSSTVEDLTLEQCAALAALPQAPGSYQLLVTEKSDSAVKIKKGLYSNDASQDRRNLVLALMEEQGYITAEEREAATKPLEDFIKPGSTAGKTSTSAFKDYLIQTVKQDLMDAYGLTEEQATKLIYTKGLRIHSTLDSQAQKIITKEFKDDSNFPSTSKKKVEPEAAMVITQVGTGKIKAMVGSRNANAEMLFNRATNARQPGSSIKPLTVYSAALQKSYEYQKKGQTFKFTKTGYDKQGIYGWGSYITVSSGVNDEKMTVNGKTWPLNVTRTYSGYNTFRTAIQKSINTCAVKILAQVGISYSMSMLKDYGITTAVDDTSEPYNDMNLAALALGAMTEGVSPLEMALAYAAFPNEGVVNSGICYTTVEDSSGKVLLKGKSEKTRVMNEGVAWIMTNVLQSVVTNGIGYPAAVDGIKVGGKTGTTDSRYDIWFDGFTPYYSAALWIGTDDNVQMDSYSEKAAALWGEIMGQVKRAKKGSYPSMPSNVYRAWNGEYYTTGTAPPEPEPEPEEEEDEDGKGKKHGADKKHGGDKEDEEDEEE